MPFFFIAFLQVVFIAFLALLTGVLVFAGYCLRLYFFECLRGLKCLNDTKHQAHTNHRPKNQVNKQAPDRKQQPKNPKKLLFI